MKAALPWIPILLVLFSGVAHAAWNTLAKRSESKQLFLLLIFIPTTIALLPLIILEMAHPGVPASAYLLILLSTIIQAGYAFFLTKALTLGDISRVYPMMRGIGILLLPLLSVVFLKERLTAAGWVGLALIVAGFLSSGGLGPVGRETAVPYKVILFTLSVGFCITGYVFVDKLNLRHFSPPALLGISNIGFMLGLVPLVDFKGTEWRRTLKANVAFLLAGSILSPLSYLLFLFAMSLSPLTYVAPLREIGTVFGTLAGIFLLHEKREASRIASAAIIFSGIVILGVWGK